MSLAADGKSEIIGQLQKSILRWQGFKLPENHNGGINLGPVENAFPNKVFPIGSIHEFISTTAEHSAASSGFIGGVLAALMRQGGVCLWLSRSRVLFPPAINVFGVEPDRIVFVSMNRDKDILWATEEALRCEGLAAVVVELREMDFLQSRRLQLAVEKSGVTGFVLRSSPLKLGTTACAARWQIRPLPSKVEKGMPGVGFPRWNVELLKVRNGNPGTWEMEWSAGCFVPIMQAKHDTTLPKQKKKIG